MSARSTLNLFGGSAHEGVQLHTLMSMCLLMGTAACQAQPMGITNQSPSTTENPTIPPVWTFSKCLRSPAAWNQFKAYWQQGDQWLHVPDTFEQGLAKQFGMEPWVFDQALFELEKRATGATETSAPEAMTLGDYCLARFVQFRFRASGVEPTPVMTRMMMPPPEYRAAMDLRGMETADARVDQLWESYRKGLIRIEVLIASMDNLRADVYRYSGLRATAIAHARVHPLNPRATSARMSTSPEYELVSRFCWEPEDSVVGSPAWFQRYEQAVTRMIDAAEHGKGSALHDLAANLRMQHQALVVSLRRIEAFQPEMDRILADLR
jgi:hypothetical protein